MEKVIIEYDNDVVSTYEIVTFRTYKKGKKEVLFNMVDDLINHPSVKSHKFVNPTKKRSIGENPFYYILKIVFNLEKMLGHWCLDTWGIRATVL